MIGYTDFFRSQIENLSIHQNGRQAYGRCPLHEDKVKSFSVNLATGQWFCHAGCGYGNALTLSRRLGITSPSPDVSIAEHPGSASTPPGPTPRTRAAEESGRVSSAAPISKRLVATYEYYYEDGTAAFRVLRYDPKGFSQERWENGEWVPGTSGIRRVPYHLPQVLAATGIIFFVEGEKDADRLDSLGLVATTTPMGANSWRDEYGAFFNGKRVSILPDNDEPGEAFALQVARGIVAAGGFVKVVRLPGLLPKGDVSDFLDNGGSKEALLSAVRATPVLGLVAHANESPLDYFKRFDLTLDDGAMRLPHEFKSLCAETFKRFTSIAKRCDDAVQRKLDEADLIWSNCRTHGQYARFLRLLKEAHELSIVERL